MQSDNNIQVLLDKSVSSMILSASGWRKVFAKSGNEEDRNPEISFQDSLICVAVALSFYETIGIHNGTLPVLVARDARPTGLSICEVICKVLTAKGMKVEYAGICSAPEIMAQSAYDDSCGFVYVSASHNPIGHNGIKFGRNGGVLSAVDVKPLIETFRRLVRNADVLAGELSKSENITVSENSSLKRECLVNYTDFVKHTTCPDGSFGKFAAAVASLNVGIVADFNGSARCLSIDRQFLSEIGVKTCFINDTAGKTVHGIVPEGENLKDCRDLLEKMHSLDKSYILGYVPDNDGDRGNLVYCAPDGKVHILKAQEVFALCVKATLEYHKSLGTPDLAVAVNGPTSMRIDDIAASCNAKTFRAEVGEANAVSLGESLRTRGFSVPILGEGSNGGNITHPAKVRDPMNTLMCILRLLCTGTTVEKALNSLPVYTTTDAFSPDAVLHLKTDRYPQLKETYEKIFENRWNVMQKELHRFGIVSYKEFQTDGITERQESGHCTNGGLKMSFYGENGDCLAYIWMRPSGTEPLFRILADVKGNRPDLHELLLNRQREMILDAEKEICKKVSVTE